MASGWMAARLGSDVQRSTISLGLALVGVLTVALGARWIGLIEVEPGDDSRFFFKLYFCTWIAYCLLYAALTLWIFGRSSGEALAARLRETPSNRRRRRFVELLSGSGGTYGAIGLCLVTLAVVIASAIQPELRGDPFVAILAFVTVASSWLLIVTVYAVDYARDNSNRGGLEFPGEDHEGAPRFSDYVYLSVQVGTGYASSDVVINRRAMRRLATAHNIVGFVFNTVIIALLVSMLITQVG